MHMGYMVITGQSGAKNLIHLVFNDGVHGSAGGQSTVGLNIDMPQIAVACDYAMSKRVTTVDDLKNAIFVARTTKSVNLIEVQFRPGNRGDIGRPRSTSSQNKSR